MSLGGRRMVSAASPRQLSPAGLSQSPALSLPCLQPPQKPTKPDTNLVTRPRLAVLTRFPPKEQQLIGTVALRRSAVPEHGS